MTRKNTNKYHYVAVQLCLYELVDFARLYVALVAGKFNEESQPTDLALCSLYGYILHRRFDSNIKQVSGMCRSHLSSNDFKYILKMVRGILTMVSINFCYVKIRERVAWHFVTKL